MDDCLGGGDFEERLGLTDLDRGFSTQLLTRGDGDGGERLLRLEGGDAESLLAGDFDFDLLRGGDDRLLCLLRAEVGGGGGGERSRLSAGLREDLPVRGDFELLLLLERCGERDFDRDLCRLSLTLSYLCNARGDMERFLS